jgi:hypothetical protein
MIAGMIRMSIIVKNPVFSILLVVLCAMCAGGCLTAERKEIAFTIKPDGSGSGKITFYNIMSAEEGKDVSLTDYTELVNKYLKGTKFEDYYPQYFNFNKRLFTQDGKLNGEITFDFLNYEDAGLYRYQNKGPWMYYIGLKSDVGIDHFDTSNGTLGSDQMPVVFWPEGTTEFHINSKFERSDLDVHQLTAFYNKIGTK